MEVVKNHDVAELLERLSLLSEASGEDRFKAIAYRRAATSVKNLGEDIDDVRKRGELTEIQYIGEGIARKIDEYLKTGRLEFLEKLEKEVPEGAVELMQVPGVGPRTAYKLSKDYGVKSVAQLRAELTAGKLTEALGAVMSKRIRESVEKMRTGPSRMLLVEALYLSRDLVGYFAAHGLTVDVAGSLRRGKSTIGDIDILCSD
ncbi:MAG: helix-hairpin-helix domain-containing protein, partial [Nitrososphaerales archaeon]